MAPRQRIALGPMMGSFALAGVTATSRLQALITIHPGAMTAQRVYNVGISPDRAVDRFFAVTELLEPAAGSSQLQIDAWKKSAAEQAPYDGSTTVDGKAHVTVGVLQQTTASGSRLTFHCRAPVEESKASLETACAQYRAELRLPPEKAEP